MIGLGTIVNTAAVAAAGVIGIFFKKGIKPKVQEILMQANGLAVIFIGISGVLQHMLVVENNTISTQGTMLLIFSMILGGLIGESLNIESKLELFGEKLKAAIKMQNDSRFVEGFVNTSLIICIGAMAIVGSIQDGLTGDSSMLIAKALLDFFIVIVFAATYGIGAAFAALPIFVYQGAITLLARLCGSIISNTLIDNLSFVGNALIFCVGVNLIREKTFRTGNLLPALLIPVAVEIYSVLF